jgi:uncharacterized damage-inducible protein DinB
MRRFAAAFVIALVPSTFVVAQTPPTNPVSRGIKDNWIQSRKNLVDSAALMPESNYSFKPIDTVRTFGAILAHVAGANYVFCSAAIGEKAPHAEDEFEKSATTKAAITKALNDSMAYCDKAYDALTDKSAAESVSMPFGMPASSRAFALVANIGHVAEHYGNLVTYFRIKGIVPPSSRQQ